MRASLQMYTFDPEANAALWQAIGAAFRSEGLTDVPERLDLPEDLQAHWRAPDLALSQTCGYPLVTQLKDQVRVVGAFAYSAPGCDGPRYASAFIVRSDDPAGRLADMRGRRVAFNSRDSQSGHNCLRAAIAPLADGQAFFSATIETGAHYRSLRAVMDGTADLAAIDCVSLAGFLRHEPAFVPRIRILGWSERVPGLPLITRAASDDATIEAMRRGLAKVVADEAFAGLRARLFIAGFAPLSHDDYAPIVAMERAAIAAGYPLLA